MKITYFWNLIHYNLFRFERGVTNVLSIPINFLLKLFVRNESKRAEIMNASQFVQNDKKNGAKVILAGIYMGSLLVLIEAAIFNFIQAFYGHFLIEEVWSSDHSKILTIIVLLTPPGIFNHIVLFKNDKYLIYFKKFEKMSKQEARKGVWMTILFILAVLLFFVASFTTLTYML